MPRVALVDQLPRGGPLYICTDEDEGGRAMTATILVFALAICGAILMWRADR